MTTEANCTDRYGLPVTTNSQTALGHYAEGLDLALSQNYGAEEAFASAAEADEGFALAYASRAFLDFLRVNVPEARANAEKAVKLSSGLSSRERGFIDVVSKFVNGQNHAATAAVHEHVKEFPRDAMMLRLTQRLYTQGCVGIGAPDYPPRFYKLMSEAAPHYGEDWAFMGQYSWANHEVGKMEEGMDLAQRSLDLNPGNGVAAHSVAHVFYEMSQDDEGGAFLSGWLEDYDRRSTYRVHLSWHQALFELAMGRYNQALGWYERDIRPSVQELKYAALADSASLVWRMKVYGDVSPQAPWSELVALAAPAADRPGPSFRDAHAALAFAAAGDEESFGRLVDGLQGHGRQRRRHRPRGHAPPDQGHRRLRAGRLCRGRAADGAGLPAAHSGRWQPRPAAGVRGHAAGGLPAGRAVRQGHRYAPRAAVPTRVAPRALLAGARPVGAGQVRGGAGQPVQREGVLGGR